MPSVTGSRVTVTVLEQKALATVSGVKDHATAIVATEIAVLVTVTDAKAIVNRVTAIAKDSSNA